MYNNDDLAWDPYGYYSGKTVGSGHDGKLGHLFYQSFPMDAKTWDINPPSLADESAYDEAYKY